MKASQIEIGKNPYLWQNAMDKIEIVPSLFAIIDRSSSQSNDRKYQVRSFAKE
ncbi:MAG: hypothetical protein J7647_06775 [Cyanobacteria bacterium SBLK]|nr:hypothetical protein [Cyanobacteria bacterium SBLK]